MGIVEHSDEVLGSRDVDSVDGVRGCVDPGVDPIVGTFANTFANTGADTGARRRQ
jgi:hypothetical protein